MQKVLCLDIGSGTQDVLYYIPDREIENCPKFILPSPAVIVGQRIAQLTKQGKNIYLYGQNMGGGFKFALKGHLKKGLEVAAHPQAALAISDDMRKVKGMGINITENCPPGFCPVYLTDFDPGFWQSFLALSGLDYPDFVLACVQDHGFHPGTSNRRGRFELWEDFLRNSQGRLEELIFSEPPQQLTRLKSLKNMIGAGMVADTGSAAILGALFVPEVEEMTSSQGICVVNVGNSHTIAFLVYKQKVWGIYEHHTGLLDGQKLMQQLERFRQGSLTNDQVFADNGHGCLVLDLPTEAKGFEPIFVLGPKRKMLKGFDVHFLSPGGDMMLAGCFGLLKGMNYRACGQTQF
ncbi:DUF1786 domain-containing protein [Desulfohalobiaceae bacterium Ax17]|uniref:DUF1786 domain-containing protein n=1 Tax=Desulfovulcanus ferrireducens TaxID=2831190 RepID=UPI00207BA64B|nr:DUF1786 domain-containing protein [Desulfovulcanus ferrireducens]MBT8762318.1 DUF1786 domain-containing protein [Desulfovulcanus ferrireducens]